MPSRAAAGCQIADIGHQGHDLWYWATCTRFTCLCYFHIFIAPSMHLIQSIYEIQSLHLVLQIHSQCKNIKGFLLSWRQPWRNSSAKIKCFSSWRAPSSFHRLVMPSLSTWLLAVVAVWTQTTILALKASWWSGAQCGFSNTCVQVPSPFHSPNVFPQCLCKIVEQDYNPFNDDNILPCRFLMSLMSHSRRWTFWKMRDWGAAWRSIRSGPHSHRSTSMESSMVAATSWSVSWTILHLVKPIVLRQVIDASAPAAISEEACEVLLILLTQCRVLLLMTECAHLLCRGIPVRRACWNTGGCPELLRRSFQKFCMLNRAAISLSRTLCWVTYWLSLTELFTVQCLAPLSSNICEAVSYFVNLENWWDSHVQCFLGEKFSQYDIVLISSAGHHVLTCDSNLHQAAWLSEIETILWSFILN